MNAEARVAPVNLLELRVGSHGTVEGAGCRSQPIVPLTSPVKRELDRQDAEPVLLEHLLDGGDRAVGVVAVGRDVDLLDAVATDELAADGGQILAQEGFAA